MIQHKLHKDIKTVIDAIDLLNENSYSIKGTLRDLTKIKLKLENGEVLENKSHDKALFFKDLLKTDIYNQLYKANHLDKDLLIDDVNAADFLSELSKVNNGLGTWEDNWLIVGEELDSGKIIVTKKDIKFWVTKDEVISENGSFIKNTPCLVKIAKEIKNLSPHFYMVFGNVNKEKIKNYENQLTRFYWNLTPKGAIEYIRLITKNFNKENICFRTKVLSNSNAYDRSDAGVLYLDKSQLSLALPIIKDIYFELKPFLKDKSPLFTKVLGKGLSFAEDPQDGSSFGISRSQIIGNTLYNCFQNKVFSKKDIANEIFTTFSSEGIQPDMPYSSYKRLNDYETLLNTLNLN